MAYFVNTPPLERILQLFNPEAASGSIGEKVYSLPIYLRRDGVVVKLGYLVRKNECEVLYTVREILVRGDLASVTVALSPVECGEGGTAKMREELVLTGVEDINPVKGRLMALDLARDGMRKVARNIATYPIHVQRVVRKHQLAILIRTSVQRFLAGFSMARSISLGCVDWRLDPGLLGLERETDFSLEYRVERFTGGIISHLDLLLGKEWDVRKIGGGGGFRVIMTLELVVDINQQIRLDTHATLCPGILDKNYRTRCMETFASSITPGQSFALFSKDNTLEQRFGKPDYTSEKFESLQSQREGVSLDWEEFRDSQDETTLEVSNTDSDNDNDSKGGFGVNANTPFDTTDCDMVEGSDVKEIESESATAIHKLLDTPTKGFSQLVFNVSNKPSGESTDDTIENVSDDVINEIVSKIREVRLSEDSLDNSFYVEKEDSQDSQNQNEKLSPIKMIFQDNRSLKYDDYSLNTSDELVSPSKLEHVVSDEKYRRSRQSTSTPEGDLAETIPDGIINDNCQESISTDHLNSKNENISQEICIANIIEIQDENQDENQASISSIRKADDTFENISDLTDDKYSYSNGDHSNNLIENSSHITSPTSSSEPPSTKDGQLTSPDEDVCSEDYRISSSNDMKRDSLEESPENDCATIISTSKDTPVDNSFLQSNDYNVDTLTAPESMVSTPQSSVNKVAAYVQSLPSPESSLSHLDRSEVIHEETEDASNLALDDSFVEDDANHSMASSRSKTSRQSDLSSLNGRFSNGMFYGSAIGASGTGAGQPTCPFPDDWQFNTIPESIENDEDID